MPESRRRAVAYIESRLQGLTSPYAVAMASYALANENKFDREVLYKFVSGGVVSILNSIIICVSSVFWIMVL